MIQPELQRIAIDDIPAALTLLESLYQLPDGMTEVFDHNALRRYRNQIKKGYYMRLAWPVDATHEQVLDWYRHAEHVLRLYRAGAL